MGSNALWVGQLIGILLGSGLGWFIVLGFSVAGGWQLAIGAPLILGCQIIGGLVGARLKQ